MKDMVVLSGTRSTGSLHLGNYFGAVENWVNLQNEYNCYFFIADWHSLTTGYENTENYVHNINEVVMDLYASGLDPQKCNIFLQSKIQNHAELHLLLSMITPLSWLERCPTYKDQLSQLSEKDIRTYGFLGYPCLMASDILIYRADAVPVGEDQLPHLEITREIARRFNFMYQEVFPEPKALLTKAKVLPGLDGRKMSKSYDNTILLKDESEVLRTKIMSMITDPARIKKTDPGHPEICSVYAFHKVFNEAEAPSICESCKKGEIGCVACKKNLYGKVSEFLSPIQERRKFIEAKPSLIREILEKGNANAKIKTDDTMNMVRKAMKINWE
ncbi:MAG: tryptophan--tRNA ligase [Clostridiaceae bacterium]|jgi:tryptophanyl-tRNA synthetase|nr:tryptophan--tRNA ligase [Clostridiaceae bacterium]